MIKWNYRATRVALVLGAIAAFAIASGAQTKWQLARTLRSRATALKCRREPDR